MFAPRFPIVAALALSTALIAAPAVRAEKSAVTKPAAVAEAAPQELMLDTIVASVNSKPITLQDLCRRLQPPRSLTLEQASQDPEARAVLDQQIMDLLIEEEAESRKIGVSDAEVTDYISEVAARNKLSLEGFEKALADERKNLADYKHALRIEILKSKLSSSFVRGSVSVSDEEIDAYLSEHRELTKSGSKVRLRQILLRVDRMGDEEAHALIDRIAARVRGGEEFANLAEEFSQAPEAKDGGKLGLIAEEDLSPVLFDAIYPLKPGEISAVTKTDVGYHLFKLEERLVQKDDSSEKELREEARQGIEREKMQDRVSHYFSVDLFKLHTVDRKI